MADGFAYSLPSAVPEDEQDDDMRAIRKALDLAYRRFEADLKAIEWDFPDWERGVNSEGRTVFRRVTYGRVTP